MSKCNAAELDFIVRDDDPEMQAVEDDIRRNLADIGITIKTHFLNETEYRAAELDGNAYHMLFTRTWGAPYDPHSYMASWAVPSHVEYSSIGALTPPLTRESLVASIEAVQTEISEQKIQEGWRSILEDVHKESLFLPLWGTRIPYVLNRRLIGFSPSNQAYSIPVNSIQVASGSEVVTISPGVGSLFQSSGPINPHQYSPNALWAQDWIYEGLVNYGQDGVIEPALATSWNTVSAGNGQKVTFQLREGVAFHDGTPWNCSAAVLNFDHVLSDTVKQRHQWFGTGKHLKSWTCIGEYELVLETSDRFYPLLQELTYIRPLRFASPSAFAMGLDSHPDLHNSCEPGNFGSGWEYLEDEVDCMGLSAPIGTGPLKFVSRLSNEDGTIDNEVVFERNDNYWGQKPGFKTITVLHYDSQEDVESALKSGELDMALGIGPLSAKQVQELKFFHSDQFDVRHSDVIQHALLVFNGNRPPMDNISVRRAVIHAVDKAYFLENEFMGLEQPVTQLLPMTAPYCNVDLSPKWGYDLEKATLLNCPNGINVNSAESRSGGDLSGGAIAGIIIASVVGVALIGLVARMIYGEKHGKPLFHPSKGEVS
ncbi:hypothetical protein ACHAXS_001501 [Conticribra weissflogii]